METQRDSILKIIKLPDLLSVINALLGFSAILFVLAAPMFSYATANTNTNANANGIGIDGRMITNALALILVAAIVDGLDGTIARNIEHSPLGVYLDSLADMLSFGVAPAIIAYVLLKGYLNVYVVSAFCGAYIICGMLRLARFDAFKMENNNDGKDFEGLPITLSAIFLASFMLLFLNLHFPLHPFYSFYPFIVIFLIAILCFLMTSRIRYRNIRDKRIAIPVGIVFFIFFFFYIFSLPFLYPTIVIIILSAFYICSPFALH